MSITEPYMECLEELRPLIEQLSQSICYADIPPAEKAKLAITVATRLMGTAIDLHP